MADCTHRVTLRAFLSAQVVKWYKEHGFDAVPIHPKESSVEGGYVDLMLRRRPLLTLFSPHRDWNSRVRL